MEGVSVFCENIDSETSHLMGAAERMSQIAHDALDKALVRALLQLPLGVLIGVILGYVALSFFQVVRSDKTEFFWGLIRTARDHQLRGLLEKVKDEATTLSSLVPLFNFFHAELADLIADLGERPDLTSDRLTKLYAAVLAGVTQVLRSPGFHRAAVLYPEGPEGTPPLSVARSFHFTESAHQNLKFSPDSIPGKVFRSGEPYYCRDTETDRHYQRNPHSTHTYRSFVCIPIRAREKTLGVFLVDAVEPEAFSKDDINTIYVFARYAAVLRQIELLVQYSVEEVARHDEERTSDPARPPGVQVRQV